MYRRIKNWSVGLSVIHAVIFYPEKESDQTFTKFAYYYWSSLTFSPTLVSEEGFFMAYNNSPLSVHTYICTYMYILRSAEATGGW